jgi:hypothetical protein
MSSLSFFQSLRTNNPELVIEAQQNNNTTRANIMAILNHNTMRGNIETGYRVWLASHISAKFHNNEVKDREQSNLARYIRNLTEIADISCYPMEKGEDDYNVRIAKVATHLYQMHQ